MITLAETQTLNEMASLLYDYLPGKPHPYADSGLSFPGIAQQVGVGEFWLGGSKLQSLTKLLILTLDNRSSAFCALILGIVQNGMIYRNSKGSPITKEEIRHLNELVANEQFLNQWFHQEGLSPRGPFRLTGEQIDGSFVIDSNTYLVEAKWQAQQTQEADLLVFRGKVEGKSTWSRGIFISHSGFTQESKIGFIRGRSTNIIGMDGQDIYFILEGTMSLTEAIHRKARRAAETGDFYVSIYELSLEGN